MLYATLLRQANMLSYLDVFRFMAFAMLLLLPLALLIKRVGKPTHLAAH
jgi:hypothetical protein